MSHLIVIKWRAFTKVKVSVMLKKLSIIFLSLVIGVGTNLSSIYATNSKASIESWIDSEVAEYFSSIPRPFSSDNEQIKDYVEEEDSQDIVKTFENDELGVKGGIMKMVLNLDEENAPQPQGTDHFEWPTYDSPYKTTFRGYIAYYYSGSNCYVKFVDNVSWELIKVSTTNVSSAYCSVGVGSSQTYGFNPSLYVLNTTLAVGKSIVYTHYIPDSWSYVKTNSTGLVGMNSIINKRVTSMWVVNNSDGVGVV